MMSEARKSYRIRMNGERITPELDYNNGKIYGIICHITDELYVGSTATTLADRIHVHRTQHNTCVSKQIIERGDYEFFIIELYPCNSDEELRAREEWHRARLPNTINKVKAFITDEERKEYKAQWHKQNYDRSYGLAMQKLFMTPDEMEEDHIIRQKRKNEADRAYRANMDEEQKARNRLAKDKYVQKVKDTDEWKAKRQALNARRKEKPKTECGCGGRYTPSGCYQKQHEETKKHKDWVNRRMLYK